MAYKIKYGECFEKIDYITYYCFADMSVEEKIEKLKEDIPEFRNMQDWRRMQLRDEFHTLFNYDRSILPLIEGVSVRTRDVIDRGQHEYIAITKMPERNPDVQQTIMRIMGALGGFEYNQWGIGAPSEAMKKHLREYRETHPGTKYIPGIEAGYPKVLGFSNNAHNPVAEAPNESYSVWEMIGFIIS